jgi:hypothetical protein
VLLERGSEHSLAISTGSKRLNTSSPGDMLSRYPIYGMCTRFAESMGSGAVISLDHQSHHRSLIQCHAVALVEV